MWNVMFYTCLSVCPQGVPYGGAPDIEEGTHAIGYPAEEVLYRDGVQVPMNDIQGDHARGLFCCWITFTGVFYRSFQQNTFPFLRIFPLLPPSYERHGWSSMFEWVIWLWSDTWAEAAVTAPTRRIMDENNKCLRSLRNQLLRCYCCTREWRFLHMNSREQTSQFFPFS